MHDNTVCTSVTNMPVAEVCGTHNINDTSADNSSTMKVYGTMLFKHKLIKNGLRLLLTHSKIPGEGHAPGPP